MQQQPGCTSSDTVLAVTTLSFDIAALELLLPLSVGGRLVIASTAAAYDPYALVALMERHAVTIFQTTPTRWRFVIESGWTGRPGLKALCGGEAMGRGLAEQLLERCAEVWNMYGPTEATVWCCIHQVQHATGAVPIGRPIAGTQAYVLDARLQPVPVGTAGELYIGGAQLARGYLGKPVLTRERFIPDPFSTKKEARLYATGDTVRWLPDGNLEFLGRSDTQVKIRGLRVELGEIESVLSLHPQLRQCAVTAYEVAPQEKALAAYVVFRDPLQPALQDVRQFLRQRLPEQMVPAAFVVMRELPLTPNGKIDRRALPPARRESAVLGDYVAPETDLQRQVAAVWQSVLHLPRIGLRDNFFELGGYSLLAVRLVNELKRTLGLTLEPMDLLAHPTIEGILPLAQDPRRVRQRPALIPVQRAEKGQPVFFTWHNTRWDLLCLAGAEDARQPFFISEVPYSAEMLLAAARSEEPRFPSLQELAAPHVELVRSVDFRGPCVVAGCSYGAVLAFEVATQLVGRGIPVSAVCLFDGNIRPGTERVKQQLQSKAQALGRRCLGVVRSDHTGTDSLAGTRSDPGGALPEMSPEALASATWDERWPFINRIWVHIMWHYWPRRLDSHGVLLRARDNGNYYSKEEDFDGSLGWGKLFAGGVETLAVPGNHYTMWQDPQVATLRESWAACLKAASAGRPTR
jgi:thioesterase domain-containing protein